MLSRRSLLGSALGASTLALVPFRSIGAQETERDRAIDPTLWGYLAQTPTSIASLDQAAPLTFGNAKLQMETLGFAMPFDRADEEGAQNWISGSYPVTLPSVIRTNAFRADFEDLTGFQIGQVFSGAEIGEPPDLATLLRGDLDQDVIRAAQQANGYQDVEIDGRSVMSLSEDASFDFENPVQLMALARLNNSAFLDDGTLVYTATLDSMRSMLDPGATLGQQPLVQQALAGLDGPLIGGAVLGPGALMPGIPLEILQPASQDEIADFILAMQEGAQAPIVLTAVAGATPGGPVMSVGDDPATISPANPKSVGKFSLVYASPEDAALAAGQIEERLATGSSQVSNAPWAEMLVSWSAVATAGQSTVLLTMEWPEIPRVLDLIFARDTAFITG